MKTPNFRAESKGKTLRLDIYDQIGPSWAGMIDAKSIQRAIANAGDVSKIDVHINSPGGSVWEGLAIFNILKEHPAKKRVKVDGVAASSASVIAMAGDTIEIPKNALMMIHNPWTIAMGYEDELRKEADVLAKHKNAIIETYLTQTKKPREEVAQMMDEETWFSGDEAVEAGFAHKTTAEVKVSAAATASVANEVAALFRRTPSNFTALVAVAMGAPTKEVPEMHEKTAEQIAAEAKSAEEAKAAADKAAADKFAADRAANDAAVKNAAGNERQRAADIMAVCNQAGKPNLAADFIGNGATLPDVQAALLKFLCAERSPVDDNAETKLKGDDVDAGYKAEYAKAAADYKKAGVSEAEYVAMRRIDDGKDQLSTKAVA